MLCIIIADVFSCVSIHGAAVVSWGAAASQGAALARVCEEENEVEEKRIGVAVAAEPKQST